MNRIATATVAALFLASSDALLVGVAPKCAPIRIFMESEMEYRKRMADTRDASKSIEWNAALAALDKITPPMVLGRPVTPIDIPALQSAISDAMAAGVEYDEIAPFEKVLLDAVKASGEDIARDPALMKLQEESAARRWRARNSHKRTAFPYVAGAPAGARAEHSSATPTPSAQMP